MLAISSRNPASALGSAGIVAGYPRLDLDTIHAKPRICIRIETLFESTLRSRAVAPRAYERQPASSCVRWTKRCSYVHVHTYIYTHMHMRVARMLAVKQNTTEQSRTEQNRTERNGTEQSGTEWNGTEANAVEKRRLTARPQHVYWRILES